MTASSGYVAMSFEARRVYCIRRQAVRSVKSLQDSSLDWRQLQAFISGPASFELNKPFFFVLLGGK